MGRPRKHVKWWDIGLYGNLVLNSGPLNKWFKLYGKEGNSTYKEWSRKYL